MNNNLCECGCGGFVKPGNRFINGHNWKNKTHSEDTKKKMRKSRSEDTKRKMRKPHKKFSKKAKKNMSKSHIGKKPSEKTKAKMRKSHLGKKQSEEHKKSAVKSRKAKGKPWHSEEAKKNIKIALNQLDVKAKRSREKHWHWLGGISLVYHFNFNVFFKKKIRTRDGNICQICGKTNEQNINETTKCLSVHHIHYDEETNDCSNDMDFITLCTSCHCMTTIGNHEYWENYFIMQKLLVA